MNYYSFHVGDFASHTSHLYPMEELAYRRMLDQYYLSESPLPLDADRVARLIGFRDQAAMVSELLSEFFLKSEDGWHNKRADEEIVKYKSKASRANAANLSRWSEKKSDVDLKSESDQIPTKNQEPRTKKSNIKKKMVADAPLVFPAGLDTDEFRRNWEQYLNYRKERKLATLKPSSIATKLQEMAGWGHQAAIRSIGNTISNGWQGLFEPNGGAGTKPTPTYKPNKYSGAF